MRCEVNLEKCRQVANAIRAFSIPEEEEEHDAIDQLGERLASNYYLLMVAICHQTQTLVGMLNGETTRGWDYLTKQYLQNAIADRELLEPSTWCNLTSERLESIYRTSGFGNTLTNPERRAYLVNDLGATLGELRADSLVALYKRSGGHVSDQKRGLVQALDNFRAYGDPIRKKTYFLLGLTRSVLGWSFLDEENIAAPVDYHEIRGHLRLGTVKIVDRGIAVRLTNNTVTQSDDLHIRDAVCRAIKTISDQLGNVSPMQLHYLFWNYFRNICIRQKPMCSRLTANSGLPLRYKLALQVDTGSPCIFGNQCDSGRFATKIDEYSLETEYY